MSLLFAATLFLSAVLLFWSQPLVGKMVLPLLGGTPAVWNTCMLFFQAALLAGYAYVLAVTRWLGPRGQAVLHAALLAAAALALPFGVSETTAGGVPSEGSPVGWLLASLALTVGPPFFVLSASAPLLQNWYSRTRARSAGDPYFLYAASNAGSLAALLGFPLLFEPALTLGRQGRLWAAGYFVLGALVVACAFVSLAKGRRAAAGEGVDAEGEVDEGAAGLTRRRRLRWVALAFVPSSLVLGATTYITIPESASRSFFRSGTSMNWLAE
ncbi:MAG TPA: hypothetical protein VD968_07405, partial [Pyrinomonadaceae bacterium]|nr:hypothetical protein [Pyrinomonadaceae bacterium]